MRYSIMGATVQQVRGLGGKDIKEARHSGIIFASLEESAVARLRALGCVVTPVGKVTTQVMPPQPVEGAPVFTPATLLALTGFDALREIADPPLLGEGINVAVVDTGIRETHELVGGGIVYRKNYTSDPMTDDFDHGTGVATLVRAMAPKCGLLNIKVLDAKGMGSEEDVAMAIDDLIGYREDGGILQVINLSLGSPDDGNPYNPMRVACREATSKGIYIRASAGNGGPSPGTVTTPAVEENVGAIGSCEYDPDSGQFYISNFSGRGPTLEGLTKPDYVCFGENIIVASSASDTATVAKSGTSFSCPQASGILAMTLEGGQRQMKVLFEQYPHLTEVIKWAYEQQISPVNSLHIYIPKIAVKPQGVAPGKDNDYGWGLPWAPLALQVFQRGILPTVIPNITDFAISIMTLGMLGMIIVPMTKRR